MNDLKNISVGVAMSGGVDSSVTVAMLQEKGANVRGFFMALAQPDLDEQINQARNVAAALNIHLTVIDLQEPFEQLVLAYFQDSYENGRTPNPCVICNPTIKFGHLLDEVTKECRFMATGHYANLVKKPDGTVGLFRGKDPHKDQSYFLFRLSQNQLQRLLFPLGEFTKEYVRQLATQHGLEQVHGTESQDVCFLKSRSVQEFLEEKSPITRQAGPVINLAGEEIGMHNGVHRYTVGQRRGLGLPDATPWYVVGLDPKKNAVIVGKDEDLWQPSLHVKDISWTSGSPATLPKIFKVKIRSRHESVPAKVEEGPDGTCLISFDTPQRAITPGQFAVFYDGNEVIGGGEILAVPH